MLTNFEWTMFQLKGNWDLISQMGWCTECYNDP